MNESYGLCMNIVLLFGAALGLSSIMMAAYIDHSLALYLSGKSLRGLLTAARYHQLYAVVVSVIGISLSSQTNIRMKLWLIRSAYIFSIGVFSFSFSIYFSTMVGVTGISYFTPVAATLGLTVYSPTIYLVSHLLLVRGARVAVSVVA